MYRNSAQSFGQVKCIPNALPSPDNTSDSDAEILDALDEKRRQLDEDIARFKAAKDREFREFEKELRVKRKRSRPGVHHVSDSATNKPPASTSSATASALNLLASAQNVSINGRGWSWATRDGNVGDKVRKPAPLSGPTLSLDKLNISGETTPPVHSLGTPPIPTLLKRSRSRSPENTDLRPRTAPTSEKEPELALTPTPSKDRSDPFAGVFTPAFLPLLESRDQPSANSPQPLTSREEEEEKKRLLLDAESKQQAEKQKLVSSQSLPPEQISPTVYATMRAKSTPILPSTSLPSALRNSSGPGRRRKHVMFQLADLKVVDPSSSYEEGPSPELEERENAFEKRGLDSVIEEREETNDSPGKLGQKEKPKSRTRNGRFISPMPSPLASPNPSPAPSPALRGSSPPSSPLPSPGLVSSPNESGFSGGLDNADDGGSGVGFFELDEELASPALRDGQPAENLDLDLDDEVSEKDAAKKGLGIVPSVTVGSVPIDIVRPSGSFIGSYGH
ncbi:hypothetical protein H2200_007312 [Cladophialophora chaetospira]|uniref:Uncharacterized protein n=1 Tax=Cladophialophora chaetospira TaxID=386627 RepID=A0AA39CHC7_9EURO|nr:hypothetical protein H2200_007312 [Cladophialophora chaetospira]